MKRVLLTALTLSAAASAAPCPVRDTWPTGGWPRSLVDPIAKAAPIKALEEYAFTLTGKDEERLGHRTDGLLIIKNGAIVYEKYGRGFDETKRHISWSMAKSISSNLIGVAVQQGALSLEDPICKHLSGYSGEVCDIKVKDILTFGSGLRWQEEYEDQSYQVSSVIAMLFGVGRHDTTRHVLGHKVIAAPSKRFNYSTGDAHVVGNLAKKALLPAHGQDAFWTLYFDKIGAGGTVFEEDLSGGVHGGSFVFATPRDFAKIGYLMLNDGCWGTERILPEGWVNASTTPSETFKVGRPDTEDTPAGYMWWLNRPIPELQLEKPWPDAPEDAYAALGHWGQRIVVIPSEDLVIVRTGDDRSAGSIPVNDLVKFALGVVR